MNPIIIVISIVVVGIVAVGLLVLISRKRALSAADRERIREMWNNVELLMADENESSWVKAVFEADKILDYGLSVMGIAGNGLGERLKNGKSLFNNVQAAWDAHKLRNQLAHEIDMKLARHEAERAVRLFKDSLRQLGINI
jgi:hypothetical protein